MTDDETQIVPVAMIGRLKLGCLAKSAFGFGELPLQVIAVPEVGENLCVSRLLVEREEEQLLGLCIAALGIGHDTQAMGRLYVSRLLLPDFLVHLASLLPVADALEIQAIEHGHRDGFFVPW